MDDRAERIGLNEALFREVNERVRSVNAGFGEPLPESEFVCECGDHSCTERITMSLEEYERIRAEGALFAVRPGHVAEGVEDVVGRGEGYEIVRKRGGDPATLAELTDPRG